MALFIPVIFWGGSALLGAYGAHQGLKGMALNDEIKRLRSTLENRQERLTRRHNRLKQRGETLRRTDRALATQTDRLFARYVPLIEALDEPVEIIFNKATGEFDVRISGPSLTSRNALNSMGDVGASVLAGTALRGGALFAVRQLGVASTGTAIRSLTGVAAQRATLSAVGGGAAAAGGGGIAAGVAALNVLAIGGSVAYFGSKYRKGKQEELRALQKAQARVSKDWDHADKEMAKVAQLFDEEERRIQVAQSMIAELEESAQRFERARVKNTLESVKDDLLFAIQDLLVLASLIRKEQAPQLAK